MTHSTPRTTPRPKAWSHQNELASRKGDPITLYLASGTTVSGTLIEADQFALKIHIRYSDKRQSVLTYYKHALISYTFTEVAK